MINYFLAKTDPDTYSIEDLEKDQVTAWDGVKNYQAVNFIKTWKPLDRIYIYHSQGLNSIVGLAEVIGLPEPDAKDKKGISWMAKIRFVKKLEPAQYISLKKIKESGKFDDFLLVRQSRLSTMACPMGFVVWMEKNGVLF
jgi:predicted RNA-binding protein with PUA-like domain